MTVSCKMTACPYHDQRGFCAKPFVINIDENGMCSVLWKRGQQREIYKPLQGQYYSSELLEEWFPKDFINIVQVKEG